MQSPAFRMTTIGILAHPEQVLDAARRLVADGVQMIELCGAFGLDLDGEADRGQLTMPFRSAASPTAARIDRSDPRHFCGLGGQAGNVNANRH